MKVTKKIIAVFLTILTILSILSTATSVFAAEYVENKARNEYFDSTLSGYLKSIVDVDGAVDIAEKEKVEDAVNEVQNSAVSNVRTFSLRSASVQSEASSKTVEEAVEDLDIDHSRLTLELEDGKNVAYLFSEPVSFIDDNGELVYKDTNIKTVTDSAYLNRGYTFENGNNDYKTYFSTDSEKGVLIVLKDSNEIRLVPSGEKSVGNSVKLNNDEEQIDAFSYQNAYGAGTLLRFLPQLNGIKDEIVLDSYNGKSDFEFTLHTGDHTAAINSKGEIEIINSKREIVQTFTVPFAYDAQGNEGDTSEHYTDCTYSLEEVSDGIYNLAVNVPEEFLTSEDTVYPVTIDPTTSNISTYYDTAIYSARSDEAQYLNHSACFGKTSTSQYGKGRAMLYFKIPTDIAKYASISSAKLWVREVTGRTDTMYVRPYLIKDSWNNTVTWETRPSYYNGTASYPGKESFTLPRRNINSTSTDNASVPYWYAFNILYAVRAWTTQINNRGLMFISENEAADADYQWRGFATKDHPTSAYHPYAVITYTNDTTAPHVSSVGGAPSSGYTNKDVTLVASATDNVYGTYGIAGYSFDGKATWQTSNSKKYTAEGKYSVKVYAKDYPGNIGVPPNPIVFTIDKTAPTATVTGKISGNNVAITVNASDSLSGVASYSFDGGTTWQTGNTKTVAKSSSISIKVKDKANNVKSITYNPQLGSYTVSPSLSQWTNGNVTITVSGTGISSYKFDSGAWSTTNNKAYSANQTASVAFKDGAGNITYFEALNITKIDKTAPTASASCEATSAATKVTVTASDAQSGLSSTPYSFNNGAWTATNYIYVQTTSAVNIRVRDNVGNIKTLSYTPDPVCPITITPSFAEGTWTNQDVRLSVTGTKISQYGFDGGAFSLVNYKDYEENTNASVTVKDTNGRERTVTYDVNNIDKMPPTISSVTAPEANPTNQAFTFVVTAVDNPSAEGASDASGIAEYSFDGGSTWQGSNVFTPSESQTVDVEVRDNAGNETALGESYLVDLDAPVAPDIYEENGLVYISSRSFDFNKETDSPEHIEYKLGANGEWKEYNDEPLEVVRTVDTTIYARVRDEAGNISQEASFTLESTLGEYTASYTDIALGEGLFPVPFGRTYSSNNGWFFTFEANIQPFTNGYVFTDFYGEKQYYIQNGESKYLSIDEDELTVNLDENEAVISYVLSYGGMTCTFDSDGRLTNIKTDYLDTDYTWGENSLTIDGGAVITFENGKPKNITVTRTDNQGTSYSKSVGYNWSNSNLMVFTDVMGTSHNNDYTNGLLTSNDGETVTYSAEGRVKLISQSNGAFVKYTYNDTAASANAETPNNIGAVTVSDSKGVTDTWYYVDGIYISSTLDGYSDKAVYDPDSISNERTADTVSDVFYIPEVVQEEENSNGDTANEAENPENPENTESENTDGTTSDTPLYEELDENSYAFYTYDEQGRMTAELKVLKASITIDENTTFADAETVAESKTTYEYVSETDDNIKEQISFIKSPNGLVIDDKECYDYENGKIQSHSKYKYISGVETALYSESYGYNAYGNVVSQSKTIYATSVDAFDVTYTTSYAYDVWGMCTETAVTCGNDTDTTRTEYDALGRTASVTYNDEKVYYTYNAFGNVTAETVKKIVGETEELKSSTTYIYDEETGSLVSCTNPDGNTSYYEYDDYGNLKKHNFNGYYFEYNTLGSILTASVDKDPNDSVDSEVLVTYTYIGADQKLSSVQYANGQTLNYVYDEETDELTAVKQGEETKFSYSQSDNGKVTTLVDNINNLIKVFEDSKVTVTASNGTTNLYSVETLIQDEEVENSFNGTRITVGDRVYTLKSEENKDIFLSGETEKFTKTYENDYAGNLWKVNTANAVTTEYGYNENSNISTLKNSLNGLAQIYGYGYDGEGNITSETLTVDTTDENGTSLTTTKTVSYTYDEYNQLTSADYGDISYAYVYDNSDDETAEHTHRGNITQKTITVNGTEQTVEYEYDTEWEDKLTSYNGQSITYDAVGNPINYLGNDLTWTMGRQLAEYRDTNGTPEKEDDILYSYTYNEDGIRTSKTVNNVTTTYYLDETNIIEQITGNTVLHFYYDSYNEIIGFEYGENNYYYVKNAMSDIVGIIDSDGNLITSYQYDPWGKVLSVTGSNTEIGNLNPFRYRSYYYDVETGFYYLQSRYYDPEVGRFINCDDVNYIGYSGTEISYNAFAYCENNPVINSDPSGLWLETVLDVVSIGWSLYDFIRQPSWLNFGFLVWDIAATCVPFAPGSYTAKGGKLCVTVASKIDDLKKTKSLTTGTYTALRKLFKGVKNVEIHHIIEKRFSKLFKKCASTDLFMSIPLEKELHKTITKRWRKEFKYGYKYSTITYSQMEKAIKNVYFDMPALKKVALDWFKKNWMK